MAFDRRSGRSTREDPVSSALSPVFAATCVSFGVNFGIGGGRGFVDHCPAPTGVAGVMSCASAFLCCGAVLALRDLAAAHFALLRA